MFQHILYNRTEPIAGTDEFIYYFSVYEKENNKNYFIHNITIKYNHKYYSNNIIDVALITYCLTNNIPVVKILYKHFVDSRVIAWNAHLSWIERNFPELNFEQKYYNCLAKKLNEVNIF